MRDEYLRTSTSLIVHDRFAAGFENWLEQLPFSSSPGRYLVIIPSMNGLASGVSGKWKETKGKKSKQTFCS